MRRSVLTLHAACLVVLASVAGCTDDPPADDQVPSPPPPQPTHVLAGAIEPASFEAPSFGTPVVLGTGGPLYGIGEPGIWAHLDGTLYGAAPGCDDGPYYLGPSLPGAATCAHGPVWRSTDGGASWRRLNNPDDGYLPGTESADAEANGDNDVAVDAAGSVYASNLGGGGIQTFRSDDNGSTWTFIGDVVPENPDAGAPQDWADRQWMAAAAPGHLVIAWMGGNTGDAAKPDRAVVLNTTFDGGETWTGTSYLGDNIGWLGPVQFAPDGVNAYVPYTQNLGGGLPPFGAGAEFGMFVGRTMDGGRTWDDLDTGIRWTSTLTGQHWSGVNMAPALDVTGDGTVVVAWSQDIGEADVTSLSTVIVASSSADRGETWSAPRPLTSTMTAAIMPWVTGGAGDRYAVTYFLSAIGTDPDLVALTWDVVATYVDGDAQHDVVIESMVHEGPICSRGGGCVGPVDRALLDYFEADLLPDGRLAVIYPANPLANLFGIDIRVAVQDGGTPLLERPASA
jgi:hypothetical protein